MRKTLVAAALVLAAVPIAQIRAVQRIVLIGDSTVCNYKASQYPWAGWGQVLAPFFQTGTVEVVNRAVGGRSSKSFTTLGQWATTVADLRSGDILMIQFGHNDRNFSDTTRYADTATFRKYLAQYVAEARARGVHPVFVTPMNMNTWTGSTVREVFTEGANDYRGAMIRLGTALKVPVLDLEKKSKLLMDSCGVSYLTKFHFLGLDAGEFPNYPDGYADGTHFQEMGALANARMVAEEIRRQSGDSVLKLLAPLLATTQAIRVTSSITGDTITRSTRLPKGATVTLKSKPAKGKVFRYWRDEKGDSLSGAKVFSFPQDGLDHAYLAVYEGVVVGTERARQGPLPGAWKVERVGGGWRIVSDAPLGAIAIHDAAGNQVARLEGAGSQAFVPARSLPKGVLTVSNTTRSGTLGFVNR